MRRLIELHEQVDEVNYFLNEWQHLKQYKNSRAKALQGPEMRFIGRTLERLIHEAELLDMPLVLEIAARPQNDKSPHNNNTVHTPSPRIILSSCIKFTSETGESISYVGNPQGMLSLSTIAEMVSCGSRLLLSNSEASGWGV